MATVQTVTKRKGRKLSDVGFASYFVALVAAAFSVVPVIYIFWSAFRTNGELSAHPLGFPSTLANYDEVLGASKFWQMLIAVVFVSKAGANVVDLLKAAHEQAL